MFKRYLRTKRRAPFLIIIVLLSVAVPVLFLLNPWKAQAVWFDDLYSYRKPITFTHNADISGDRRITVSIDTAALTTDKMQADCDDTRFTDINGKILRFVLVSACDSASTRYEVVFSTIVNGTNVAYVYYGNPVAVSASEPLVMDIASITPSGGGPAFGSEAYSPGPVSYWKFDEGSGNATDSTIQGNSLTLTNAVRRTEDLCLFGKCLSFDGDGDHASKTYSSDTEFDPGTGSFTVSAWFRHSSNLVGYDYLLSRFNGAGWQIYTSSSGLCFGIDDDSIFNADDDACTTNSYADSTWHFLTAVKNSTTSIELYIDGVRKDYQGSLTATGSLSGISPAFRVGIDGVPVDVFSWDGQVDEVKYYNHARTASQIASDYNARAQSKGASARAGSTVGTDTQSLNNGLVAYLKLDENTGTNAADSSGNSNNGTLVNAPAWANGKFGSGVKGDGLNDYINVSDSTTLDLTSNYTISLWFSPNATVNTSSDYVQGLIDKGSYSIFLDKSDGKLKAEVNNGGTSWTIAQDNVAADSQDYEQAWSGSPYLGKYYFGTGNSTNDGDVWSYDGTTWTISYNNVAADSQDYERVYDLAVYKGNLYAGVGTAPNEGDVWVFNGSTWSISYDNISSDPEDYEGVYALDVYNGKLYAAVGGNNNEGDVWAYNGTSWSISYDNSAPDPDDYTVASSLAVYNGNLYAGMGSGANDADVWVFNGTSWSKSYDNTGGSPEEYDEVLSLAVYNGNLYAGVMDGGIVNKGDILSFNGTSWITSYNNVASDPQDYEGVYDLAAYGGRLYAGMSLDTNEADVWVYDGTSWTISYDNISADAQDYEYNLSLGNFGGKLYAGKANNTNDGDVWVLDSGNQLSSSTDSWPLNTWQHIAVLKNGTTLSMYINGVFQSKTTLASSTIESNTFPLLIGKNSGSRSSGTGDGVFNGTLDDIRIYNRALSETETKQLSEWSPGPVGHWKLDENTGTTAADSSGNSYTGTLTNNPVWDAGKFGSGVRFDGGWQSNSDVITLGDQSAFELTQLSVSAWVYRRGNCNFGTCTVFSKGMSTSKGYALQLYDSGGYKAQLSINDALQTVTGTTTINENTWYHVAATFNGTTVNVYVNGVMDATAAQTQTPAFLTEQAKIGNRNDNTDITMNGIIDDVRLYNYVRAPGQIVEDMNGGHPAPGSPVGSYAGYWKLDEAAGTTAYDASINAKNLTLNASDWSLDGKFNGAFIAGRVDRDASVTNATQSEAYDFSAVDSFSISAWAKSSSPSNPGSIEALVAKASDTAAGYSVYFNTSGQVCIGIDDDSSWGPDISTCTQGDFYDYKWHHILGVRDTATDKLLMYVDGILRTSTTDPTTASLDNDQSLRIGQRTSGDDGDEFQGLIDEVKIYRSALTVDQAKLEFNQGQQLVLGSLSTLSDGNTATGSAGAAFCPPGDTATCRAPIGYWKLDENLGSAVNDASGKSNNGTLTNGPLWRAGKSGSSLVFDGQNDYVALTTSLTHNPTNNMTVMAWVKSDVLANNRSLTEQPFFEKSGVFRLTQRYNAGAVEERFYFFWIDTSSNLRFALTTNTTVAVQKNTWYHVAGVRDGASMKIYINGVDTTVTTSNPAGGDTINATNGNFNIGGNTAVGGGGSFFGMVDDAKLYDYARTPAQIAWDYSQGKPASWWKFDECQGSTVYDNSLQGSGVTNGNNLTIFPAAGNNTSVGSCSSGTATEMWNDGTVGKYNSSLGFDGDDDHASASATNVPIKTLGVTDFTIATWFISNGTDDTFVSFCDGVGGNELRIRKNGSSVIEVKTNNVTRLNTTSVIASDTWYHVAVTRVGSLITGYINGRAEATGTDGTALIPLGSIGVGSDLANDVAGICTGPTSSHLEGKMDDLRTYNYALTPTQVKLLVNENFGARFGPAAGSP